MNPNLRPATFNLGAPKFDGFYHQNIGVKSQLSSQLSSQPQLLPPSPQGPKIKPRTGGKDSVASKPAVFSTQKKKKWIWSFDDNGKNAKERSANESESIEGLKFIIDFKDPDGEPLNKTQIKASMENFDEYMTFLIEESLLKIRATSYKELDG